MAIYLGRHFFTTTLLSFHLNWDLECKKGLMTFSFSKLYNLKANLIMP